MPTLEIIELKEFGALLQHFPNYLPYWDAQKLELNMKQMMKETKFPEVNDDRAAMLCILSIWTGNDIYKTSIAEIIWLPPEQRKAIAEWITK